YQRVKTYLPELAGIASIGHLALALQRVRGILPAAAEREDEIDTGLQLHGIEIERGQLGLQQSGLGSHDGEIVGGALDVQSQGEVEGALRGIDGGLLLQGGLGIVVE